jgi:WD40 repeat protein
VLLVDAQTGEPMGSPLRHGKPVLNANFSPDSELLVTCGGNTARLWRIRASQPLGEPLRHDDKVAFAAFSADGRTIATASVYGAIHLWDARGASLGVLKCKRDWARSLMFHPSGLLLAAFTDDQLQLWDVTLQQEVSPRMAGLYNMMGVTVFRANFGANVISTILNPGFDLPCDDRPVGELVKLTQLYSGRRLNAHGVSLALSKEERQSLWRELRARYPAEFTISAETALKWRSAQLASFSTSDRSTARNLNFHRRWFAAEQTESGWFP